MRSKNPDCREIRRIALAILASSQRLRVLSASCLSLESAAQIRTRKQRAEIKTSTLLRTLSPLHQSREGEDAQDAIQAERRELAKTLIRD